MDFWSRARSFAEEAAKRSQELGSTTLKLKLSDIVSEAAKRSQELGSTIVSETAKRSKELAAEASTQIKSMSLVDPTSALLSLPVSLSPVSQSMKEGVVDEEEELRRFGVTDELREFVQTLSAATFQEFSLLDDGPVSDVPTVANVRQDLSEWQARHATLVLSTVKEVSKLRYELCPRIMKERKFWKVYFMLVNSHVTAYEKNYEEAKLKSEQEKDDKANKATDDGTVSKSDGTVAARPLKKATSSAEQDLDAFLLGDLADIEDGPDADDDGFDDDFDKIGDSSDDELKK